MSDLLHNIVLFSKFWLFDLIYVRDLKFKNVNFDDYMVVFIALLMFVFTFVAKFIC